MSEWKKLGLGFGIFCCLAFIGDNYLMNQRTQAQAQVTSPSTGVPYKETQESNVPQDEEDLPF